MTDPLLEPLVFRNGRVAPNRCWLAPMTNKSSHPDGHLSEDELRFLTARAEGSFGVVETCATHVSIEGQGWENEFGIFDDVLTPDWRRLAAAVQEHDVLLLAQLFHGGARALRGEDRPLPWSASASDEEDAPVRRGSEADILAVIEAFAEAARRAESAGADGVELHGAHGYLLCQFLSTTLNRRDDRWGGALEGRARLLRETMRATRAAVSDRFIVGVRLSPESFGGLTGLDLDESIQVARGMCEDGADFIHLSLWDASRDSTKRPGVHTARAFRDALPEEVPIITAGKVWTREDALAQLEHGASAVAVGRAAIADARWPERVAAGREPRRPPLTPRELAAQGLGPAFIDYMRKWDGFVTDET